VRHFGRQGTWIVAVALAVALSGCSGLPAAAPTHQSLSRLRIHLDLNATHTVAGRPIKAALIIYNPQGALDVAVPLIGQCRFLFDVVLMRGRFHAEEGVPACLPGPLVITHGTNRLPFTLDSRYNGPTSNGVQVASPKPHTFVGFPPLPPGSYQAVTYWFTRVPLPRPKPLTVVLTG